MYVGTEDLTLRLQRVAGMVLGRQTSDEFSAFWPVQPATDPFASLNNNVRKFVISDSLEKAYWNNSSVVRRDEVAKLKSEQTGDLHITGSGSLVRALMAMQLLDELHLLTFPAALGSGRRFFDGAEQRFELARVSQYPRGVMHSVYQPAAVAQSA